MTQLDFSLGISQEVTYGAPVAATRFPESDAQLKYEISTVDGRGLRPKKGAKRLQRNSVSKYEGKGSISLDVGTRGFGFLLNALFGSVTNTVVPTTTPEFYQQVHTLSVTDPIKTYTIQELLPALGADDVHPHTFTGCAFDSMTISAKEGGIVEAVFEVVTRALLTTEAAATPSYPATDGLFTFTHGAIKIGSSAMIMPSTTNPSSSGMAESVNVTDVSVSVKRNLDAKGWNLGGAGLRSRPPVLGRPEITGSLTAEYSNNTLRDAYLAQSPLGVLLTFTHDAIASGAHKGMLQIVMPSIRLKGEVPGSNNGEPITQSIDFEAFDDGVRPQPIFVVYRTLDTTP